MSDNPRAFPCGDQQGTEPGYGMTLRDWFAGQALAGWLGSYNGNADHPCTVQKTIIEKGETSTIDLNIARNSYTLADAMLEARKAKP